MEKLKNNIEDITKDGENLVRNYLKLFGIRQSERLASLIGLISSIFLISTLLLIVIIFGSFVLADLLNSVLDSKYLGFLIIAILYILAVGILIIKMQKTGRPLFTNLYIKFILPLLNIEINQNANVEGLKIEEDIVKERIENEKKILNAHTQLFKYVVFEDLLKEIGGLFTSKVNPSQKQKTTVKKESKSKTNLKGETK
jgi:hypothetical protein